MLLYKISWNEILIQAMPPTSLMLLDSLLNSTNLHLRIQMTSIVFLVINYDFNERQVALKINLKNNYSQHTMKTFSANKRFCKVFKSWFVFPFLKCWVSYDGHLAYLKSPSNCQCIALSKALEVCFLWNVYFTQFVALCRVPHSNHKIKNTKESE